MSSAFFNLLRKTKNPHISGLTQQYFAWMDEIEDMKPFFEWLESSITEDNCITVEELEMFKRLKANSNIISDEELISELSDFMGEEEDFTTSDDLSELEGIIEAKGLELAALKDHAEHLRNCIEEIEAEANENVVETLFKHKLDEYRQSNSELVQMSSEICGIIESSAGICLDTNEANKYSFTDSLENPKLDSFFIKADQLQSYIKDIVSELETRGVLGLLGMEENIGSLSPENIKKTMQLLFSKIIDVDVSIGRVELEILAIERINRLIMQNPHVLFSPSFDVDIVPPIVISELRKESQKQTFELFTQLHSKFCEGIVADHQRVVEYLGKIIEIAQPLQICGDSLILLKKNELSWINMFKNLVADVKQIFEILQNNLKTEITSIKQNATLELLYPFQNKKLGPPTFSSLSVPTLSLVGSSFSHSQRPFPSTCGTTGGNPPSKKVQFAMSLESYTELTKDMNHTLNEVKSVFEAITKCPREEHSLENYLLERLKDLEAKKEKAIEKTNCLEQKFTDYEASLRIEPYKKKLHNMWFDYCYNRLDLIQFVEKLELEARILKETDLNIGHGDILKNSADD